MFQERPDRTGVQAAFRSESRDVPEDPASGAVGMEVERAHRDGYVLGQRSAVRGRGAEDGGAVGVLEGESVLRRRERRGQEQQAQGGPERGEEASAERCASSHGGASGPKEAAFYRERAFGQQKTAG